MADQHVLVSETKRNETLEINEGLEGCIIIIHGGGLLLLASFFFFFHSFYSISLYCPFVFFIPFPFLHIQRVLNGVFFLYQCVLGLVGLVDSLIGWLRLHEY